MKNKGLLMMYTRMHLQGTSAELASLNCGCPLTTSAGQCEIPPPVLNVEKNKLHFQSCGNNYISRSQSIIINSVPLPREKKNLNPWCITFVSLEKKKYFPTDMVSYETICKQEIHWTLLSLQSCFCSNNSNRESNYNIYNYFSCYTPLYWKCL